MELISIISYMLQTNALKLEIMGAFIVLDIITGLIKAVINREVQSSKMRTGLLKKLLEMLVIIFACMLDALMTTDYITTACLIFLIAMEGLSIVENIGEYIALPSFIKDLLENLKEQGDNGK